MAFRNVTHVHGFMVALCHLLLSVLAPNVPLCGHFFIHFPSVFVLLRFIPPLFVMINALYTLHTVQT